MDLNFLIFPAPHVSWTPDEIPILFIPRLDRSTQERTLSKLPTLPNLLHQPITNLISLSPTKEKNPRKTSQTAKPRLQHSRHPSPTQERDWGIFPPDRWIPIKHWRGSLPQESRHVLQFPKKYPNPKPRLKIILRLRVAQGKYRQGSRDDPYKGWSLYW